MRNALIFTALASAFLVSVANAEVNIFEGIEMATIEVSGKEYTFPVGDIDRKNDIYYLKKGLAGDKAALEMFLGGAKEKWFYIGIDTPLWLKVTKDKAEVIKP